MSLLKSLNASCSVPKGKRRLIFDSPLSSMSSFASRVRPTSHRNTRRPKSPDSDQKFRWHAVTLKSGSSRSRITAKHPIGLSFDECVKLGRAVAWEDLD